MFKISCSILCYNYGQYLEKAIDSCLLQPEGNYELEVLVIDDGSTDNTPEICNSYGNKIRYFRSANEGFAASLTKAVKYAKGDIICLLDADDYFLPGKINAIVEEFEKEKTLLFLYHDQLILDASDEVVKDYQKGGNTSTQVFKKKVALDLLPAYNEQFFFTLYMAGRGKHLKKKLSHYRIHKGSMSKPDKLRIWKEELIKMNVLHLSLLKQLIESPPYWADRKKMEKIYAQVASGYNYLKMERALNRCGSHSISAFKRYIDMLYWDLKAKKVRFSNIKYLLTYFILKRYIKY